MSLAEDTRAAVRRHPFLLAALRAGVVNYTAAARFLDDEVGSDADRDAVATALRRFAESLPEYDTEDRDVRVSMKSGLGAVSNDGEHETDALFAVGDTTLAPSSGSTTGILAEGDVDAAALGAVLGRLDAEGVGVLAAGVGGDALLVAVERRDGPDALRAVESAVAAVPTLDTN